MTYDIFDNTAPAMPKPSKGTEVCKLLLSQASKDMCGSLFLMFSLYFARICSGGDCNAQSAHLSFVICHF